MNTIQIYKFNKFFVLIEYYIKFVNYQAAMYYTHFKIYNLLAFSFITYFIL